MKHTSEKLEKAGFKQAMPNDKLFRKKKVLIDDFYCKMYLSADCFSSPECVNDS